MSSLSKKDLISPEAQEDIKELKTKIELFKEGKIDEERFKAFRLARGVYGQRQQGVQMFRTKIPYGKLTADQLSVLADLSDQFSTGNLHLTTRQNIQLHYVNLDDSPQLWEELEAAGITGREACGNTLRNITASPSAGIDPQEPFDVSPYVQAVFEYFLRYPVNQEMGRKIKIAFSSSDKDNAYGFIHDFGFIPKIKLIDGKEVRGFRVLIGGGLGAQPFTAQEAFDFLPSDQLIPFIESGLRVFDRYGEREKRFKARMKYLIEPKRGLGLDTFLELAEKERTALPFPVYTINPDQKEIPALPKFNREKLSREFDRIKFEKWREINVFEQKQKGFYAAQVRVPKGDIHSDTARKLSGIVKKYAADDIRITINQGLLLKFIPSLHLPHLFAELDELGLAEPGFDSFADITSCPGTDTCNLAVTNSTGLTVELEKLISNDYPELVGNKDLHIKISGCMNSCGQHMIADIGFHGSSIRNGDKVLPAMQIVLGGGLDENGNGLIAEKVIKLPTKRIPRALKTIIDDFQAFKSGGEEKFHSYFKRQGKRYFYDILKPLADTSAILPEEYLDWGADSEFIPEIGTGECAGVSLDVIGTIIKDAGEKLEKSNKELYQDRYAHSIYFAYSSMIIAAKAVLLSLDISCNTHAGIISDFQKHLVDENKIAWSDFKTSVLEINKNNPSADFASKYNSEASEFFKKINDFRANQISNFDKVVVSEHYKA
ncbi:HEPN domain-containing protein [Mangrovivirga sp. M17]|uniref:HEPN domain-containing protein n=1 Tax=Mangrovivirga halotolerans TaxID=2993936 RepID=A0ABT3RWI8_9BACT|nr:HEPN domain-containing protein [Mangrovivirga halotolerans]MCX2745704.1 HEPN domain-containing protein [Mangrovivirga halotolerans]